MNNTYILSKSNLKTKKYKILTPDGHTIQFGAYGYEDYTIHKDDKRKERYIMRHQANEDWNTPNSAGFFARWILWNKKSLSASINDTEKRFNIKIKLLK